MIELGSTSTDSSLYNSSNDHRQFNDQFDHNLKVKSALEQSPIQESSLQIQNRQSFRLQEQHPVESAVSLISSNDNCRVHLMNDVATSTGQSNWYTKKRSRFGTRPRQQRWIQFRYVLLSVKALLVTVICPHTVLWQRNSFSIWIQFVFLYLLVMISFFLLHGTDPGYLTSEVMARWYNSNNIAINNQGGHILLPVVSSCSNETVGNGFEHQSIRNENEQLDTKNDDSDQNVSRTVVPSQLESSAFVASSSCDENDDCRRKSLINGSKIVKIEENIDSINNELHHLTRRYCSVCTMYPPIRSHHCRQCNQCVASFDHHCYFIGTCIGERNHSLFYCFLMLQMIGFMNCCFIIHSSNVHVFDFLFNNNQQNQKEDTTNLQHENAWLFITRVVVAKLYLYPLTFAALLMAIIHTLLIISNMKTFEFSKGSKHIDYLREVDILDLPFSKGLVYNFYQFFCILPSIKNKKYQNLCSRGYDVIQTVHAIEINARAPPNDIWIPYAWNQPRIDPNKYSEDWYNHPWRNKYWQCC